MLRWGNGWQKVLRLRAVEIADSKRLMNIQTLALARLFRHK